MGYLGFMYRIIRNVLRPSWFAKVAPLPPEEMQMGTVSVSAGNENER
jgi:hypothetical protein